MKNLLFFVVLIVAPYLALAQQDIRIEFANSITEKDLYDYLSILASDSLQGRETATPGQQMAASFVENHFRNVGLEPLVDTPDGKSYYQHFDLIKINPSVGYIVVDKDTLKNLRDFLYTGQETFEQPVSSKPIFLEYNKKKGFDEADIKGKDVIICCAGNRTERNARKAVLTERGAKNIIIIMDEKVIPFEKTINHYKRYMSHGRLTFPERVKISKGYFLVSPATGARMLGISRAEMEKMMEKYRTGKRYTIKKKSVKEISFFVSADIDTVRTGNVLAVVEGSDKKDEYIFVTAHYDHLGTRDGNIYNGADDNGSGTAAIMEIAQAFALAKKAGHGPRRSVVFMAMTGEEKGLLGSSYYVRHPVVPLANTVADLNIDMVGRIDPQHKDSADYIYLIGSDKLSMQLHNISERCNAKYTQLVLDYTYNDEKDPNRFYYRSDHYNFAKNDIPVIFYFNGTHDDYHRYTDTIDKIDFPLFRKRTLLVFFTAWELANMKDRIVVDITKEATGSE